MANQILNDTQCESNNVLCLNFNCIRVPDIDKNIHATLNVLAVPFFQKGLNEKSCWEHLSRISGQWDGPGFISCETLSPNKAC